jgi:hypothetical protein
VVITLVRGDGLSVTGADQRWLMALASAAARTGVHLRMLCLATRDGVRQLDPMSGKPGPGAGLVDSLSP